MKVMWKEMSFNQFETDSEGNAFRPIKRLNNKIRKIQKEGEQN
jgi:hypothetical protein